MMKWNSLYSTATVTEVEVGKGKESLLDLMKRKIYESEQSMKDALDEPTRAHLQIRPRWWRFWSVWAWFDAGKYEQFAHDWKKEAFSGEDWKDSRFTYKWR